MSTRSRIAMTTPNGAIYSIYCHFDGYPDGVGATLLEHWTNEAKIRELIELGDLSVLGSIIGKKVKFDGFDYKNPQCLAYGRDRGEPDTKAATDDTEDLFFKRCQNGWEEWAYIWHQGHWYASEVGGDCGPFLAKRFDPDGTLPPNWQPLEQILASKAA